MKLVHYAIPGSGPAWGLMEFEQVHLLALDPDGNFLCTLLRLPDPAAALRGAYAGIQHAPSVDFAELEAAPPDPARPHLLPPLDRQEVWAAGVTYLRSRDARMEESEGGARFYDLVYDAERPELFLKGTRSRVVGPNAPVRIRHDSDWDVPEPEIALLLSSRLRIVGYTVGNDMSSRDIEGANPLYLPQAKVYAQSCALGPVVQLETEERDHTAFDIALTIERAGQTAFAGTTSTLQMKRKFGDLVDWLGRDNCFPDGAYLLTGTGLVPGDDFTLAPGDIVTIAVEGIGTLRNPVVRGALA